MEFQHKPVLFRETIEALRVRPGGDYIDGTVGGGGHSQAILRGLEGRGRLLAIDQDPDAIEAASRRLSGFPNVEFARGNFGNMAELAEERGISGADGILLDIGVSSHQLDDPGRGFSYHYDAPLDMRMSQEGPTAADLVNSLSQGELAGIILRYGEDRSAGRIAAGICKAREEAPIRTTVQLAEIIKASVPAAVRRGEGHPARKTFQALRIAVNGELDRLEEGLEGAFSLLKPQGRLAVITFHSLEDRLVKRRMAQWCQGCTCPKDFPVCVCGKKPQGRLVYKKGVAPSPEETAENPRARSARLRVFERARRE
ncbi:16S rRNA (cytosine(1402)-N(4))-methyltransferase RsmH [Acutalibacter sp. 1XD8-33]|uniref:16S rRNA (cytosine(1402)-N(4))-methyltransferase RsmH n=1 Tax=Acutalibacter sp. 1XD8-33 TaxID=2320081 RepID=UPI000EA0A04F|nr:16S rRNA (cytosine(1402)-N(4))-methyltransferase RsmH [Acutalibacter sp. 1XD8-33]RKJ42212.1 16S rRNA (cytosine(1402)-N(4))-methyltransferase RsmH [Acutalibacter sp. 1XD8-33]